MYKLTFFTEDEKVAQFLFHAGSTTPEVIQAELFELHQSDCQINRLVKAENKRNGAKYP